jgi:hypothetical protein
MLNRRAHILVAAAIVAALVFAGMTVRRRAGASQWKAVSFPQQVARDGNRANVVYHDADRKLIGLAATGVVRWGESATFGGISNDPADGYAIAVSAAGRSARLELRPPGPALFVALPGVRCERFDLTPEAHDAILAAARAVSNGNPAAPLDRPSVVDAIRDAYAGPDKPRLDRLLDESYRVVTLTAEEQKFWGDRDRDELHERLPATSATMPVASTRPARQRGRG